MNTAITILALLTLTAAPAMCGVTIEYTATQAIGAAGHSMTSHHTHSYTSNAARVDVAAETPVAMDIAAIIKADKPYMFIKIGSGPVEKRNIHEYEDGVLPDAAITPLETTKNILGCAAQGFKFKARRITGTYWVCADKQWAEAYAFSTTLLKTLGGDFGLYQEVLDNMPKNGIVFEVEARKASKSIFSAKAVSVQKERYPKNFFSLEDDEPIAAGEDDSEKQTAKAEKKNNSKPGFVDEVASDVKSDIKSDTKSTIRNQSKKAFKSAVKETFGF